MLEALRTAARSGRLSHDPFDRTDGRHLNLPAGVIMGLVTTVLVVGIRESARTNATLVLTKLVVVVFVIVVGWAYVNPAIGRASPSSERALPQEKKLIPELVEGVLCKSRCRARQAREQRSEKQVVASYRVVRQNRRLPGCEREGQARAAEAERDRPISRPSWPTSAADRPKRSAHVDAAARRGRSRRASEAEAESWGLLGMLGLNRWLIPIDDATRSPFMPYGLSGIMLGAAIVFFAFIGFDSISTHAEEARRPQRDVPIGILVSLFALHAACTSRWRP